MKRAPSVIPAPPGIPAQAGIQPARGAGCDELDSRLRGNDEDVRGNNDEDARQHDEDVRGNTSQPSPINSLPTTTLLGVRVHAISERQCIETIIQRAKAGLGGWVVTPNLDILRRCVRDRSFNELIGGADLVVADGMPLVWASRLRRTPLPERVAGSTLISTLSAAAAGAGLRVFLLGGAPGTADGAAAVLRQRHTNFIIAGTHCPPMGFENSLDEIEHIETILREAAPDIVFVGLGSPKQENLIRRMRPLFPKTWWLGIGVSFSFLCGHVHRAPVWMQKAGLEWAHRLAQEPNRLAKRYLIDGLPFAAHLLVHAAWEGARSRR